MADTDLIERLDRDIQMAERARSEMIAQGHPGWPNAVLFLMETATEARTQITASRAECEGLRAAIRGLLDCPDIADNDYKDEETHAAERQARAALSQKETGNAA